MSSAVQVPTGEQLVHQLWKAANAREQTLGDIAALLSPEPRKFIRQLRQAKRPTPDTVERIRAAIDGRPVPPPRRPRSYNFTCRRDERPALGLGPSVRQIREERSLQSHISERERVEWRRALAERAAHDRRPGETLHEAVKRLERAAGTNLGQELPHVRPVQ